MREVLFFLFGAGALAGSFGVVLGRNPVHCALFLAQTLVCVAVLFLLQDAELVAVVQVIVYASAVVVLFLFVIMLLGIDREEAISEPIKYQRPAAIAIGALVIAEILYLTGHQWATGAASVHGTIHVKGQDNVERVARVLFTDFLWPFEITAALLVIAVVGSIVLARRSGQRTEPPLDADLLEPEPRDDANAYSTSGEPAS
jgi:NADH-quinone oxidoreductase subunit J